MNIIRQVASSMVKFKYMKRIIIYFCIAFSISLAETVYHIPIEGTIDLGLPPFIERSIAEAEENNAKTIIFEVNTFGGRVDAATQIKDAILDSKVPTVAFINKRAISAGALISLSCEKIFMAGGATIGATTAVDMQGNKASEKVISYMREEMAATAEKRGRDTYIARGMVDEELEFPNKVIKEFINDGEDIDTIKTKVYYLVIDGDTVIVDDIEGRKQGNLITLTTEQSLKYKIADASLENFEAVLDTLGFSNLVVNKTTENWSENFVRFLTNPVVASLLTTFGFLGILFELQSPGWGIPGSIGLICLALSLSASYIAELATMSDLLVILMGMLFLMLEAFVFPGFGVAGVAGIIFILWGLYLLLLPDVPVGEEVLSQASNGLIIGMIGGLVGLVLLFRAMTKTKFWRDLTSPDIQKKEDGYVASFGWEKLVGEEALTETDLHPSGWINVGNERVFALSEGNFIDKNVKVVILSVDGNRVVVRKK
ncbi:nodulation protein NfeD [bacterium]|nr:MAG: nodulation protein NfeD [bacterium]|tara:strand:- start:16337 stop:17791 length:1455 start_codon:yes stop_codon:yes gene_type:complete